jgi:thiamine biosynthesis protein ThiS
MKIVLNNKSLEIKVEKEHPGITINHLLEEVSFSTPVIMVRVNDRLIKKENYNEFIVKPGDQVAIIPLVDGG